MFIAAQLYARMRIWLSDSAIRSGVCVCGGGGGGDVVNVYRET